MKFKHFILVISIGSISISCVTNDQKIKNLHSFAKVYGYVRWFYPGDEAAKLEWEKFAIYGVKKVENARNEIELKQILIELFKPIAPTLVIASDDSVRSMFIFKTPPNITNLMSVSWLHYGVGLSKGNNVYKSIRINRDSINTPTLIYYINNISEFKGKEIKLTILYKTSDFQNANCSLHFSTGNSKRKTNASSKVSFTSSKKWKQLEIVKNISEEDDIINFSFENRQIDTLWIKDIKLSFKKNNTWNSLSIYNQNFEKGLDGWYKANFFYDITIDSLKFTKGRIIKIYPTKLKSKVGDYFHAEIGNDLSITMPLVLYADKNNTFPIVDKSLLLQLHKKLEKISTTQLTTNNNACRLANVIIAWNVFQHFYPYFDVIKVDWERELTKTLQDVYLVGNEIDYYRTLCKMISSLNDGHGRILSNKIKRWYLPIKVEWIENKVVITKTKSDLFKIGDIVIKIDDKSYIKEIQEQKSLISGSEQYKHNLAMSYFGTDFESNFAQISILRNRGEIKIRIQRKWDEYIFSDDNPKLEDLGNGIFYLGKYNLTKDDFDRLASAKGVIMNGSCNSRWELLPHIINQPVLSPQWHIPITSYPDRRSTSFDVKRWTIEPKKPKITAKFSFIVHSSDISSIETFLGIVNYYKLGKLIGEPSAGTNGNINIVPLMGGYSIMWTGMKVIKHDGSQHHLIGIKPDYPVQKTIGGISDYRDELFEMANKVLKEEVENP